MLPVGDTGANSIVEGPDGALWLAETNQILRMTPSGNFTVLPVKGKYDYNYLAQITVGADKNIWFTKDPNSAYSAVSNCTMSRIPTLNTNRFR